MTCGEVREYLFAFLDGELDAPLSIELQRHLERCPGCARDAEIEREVRHRLARCLDSTVGASALDDDFLRQAIVTQQGTDDPGHRRLRGRLLAVTSVAAMIALGAILWIVPSWGDPRPTADQFADWIVADFKHFVDTGSRVQFACADTAEVADWLRAETGLSVALPTPASAAGALPAGASQSCQLLGARKCELDGRPAAFAVFRIKDRLASLVVVERAGVDLDHFVPMDDGERTVWVDRYKGHSVVAYPRGALLYAAVSSLPREELFCLISSGAHEGN